MKVFLLGFMGAGKSFLGKKAALMLGWQHIDLDKEIELYYKMTINSIFENFGEEKFRELEHLSLKRIISSQENLIISCGGGTPCFYDNMSLIKNSGLSIYLKMSDKALFNRIKNSKNKRPILNINDDAELLNKISNLLQQREHFYNQSDVIYEAISSSPKDIVEIIRYFQK